MNELRQLAAFAAETRYEDFPSDVVTRALAVLRDTIGVIIGGMNEPEVSALAAFAATNHPGPATIFGTAHQTRPEWAALVHGTAGTSLEMDEGHAFARGHAAIHAVPPALALAERHDATLEDMLAALIVGYEVAARAGIATKLRKGVHPFGAWGVLGAATVAARFKNMNADDLLGALEVAASYAIAPSFNTAYQGANVRNTYAGMVNQLGMQAADFYELGFRGERGGVQTAFGQLLGDSFDEGALVDGLGSRYEIMRGYFKPYSGCRYSHAAIDAALNIMDKHPFDAQDIEKVEVATYDIAAHLSDPEPHTPLAGRFSVPYIVAATLTLGHAGPLAFREEALRSPQILGLARRVQVSEDPAFTAMTPAKRPARVTLHLTDGSLHEHTVTGSKGDPDQPMSEDELHEKFLDLAASSIDAEAAWAYLSQPHDLKHLFHLLKGGHYRTKP